MKTTALEMILRQQWQVKADAAVASHALRLVPFTQTSAFAKATAGQAAAAH
ncbi:MAG TPA: hypothetical protein VG347_08380 [Verrucomicrobiae bacterium]|nr:hypothetical protein [Verrucomicrobiae bacterium]